MKNLTSIPATGATSGECRINHPMAPASPCRFWLVDDDGCHRDLQRSLLQRYDHLTCSGSYPSADAALLELTRAVPPDIILMDLNMPGTNGIEAIPLVRALAPQVRILLNSTFMDPLDERAALAAGASGYLPKWRSLDEFLSAIQDAMSKPVPVAVATRGAVAPLDAPWRSWLHTLRTRLVGILSL